MAKVRLYCGQNRSRRSALLDRFLIEHWGRALLITPTRASAARRCEELLITSGQPGTWGRFAWSFTDFATELLRAEGMRVRCLGDFERRLVLERCRLQLSEAGRLPELKIAPDNPGLVNHLLRVITQLKQAAIDPAAFRLRLAQVREASPFDAVVAEAYDAYQAALLAGNLYDTPGLYWQSVLIGGERRPALLDGVDVVALDGFDDFTPSEFRLLEILRQHVAELFFGINYDEAPDRQDLYALPAATVQRLQEHFDITAVSVALPEPTRFSEYAARRIFWRDPPEFPEGLDTDLSVLPCSDVQHEVETIGRRIKTLIVEQGVASDRIAVVFRDLGGVAEALRAVFDEFGIPIRMSQHPAIAESAVGALLVRLFDAVQRWERETVLDVLQSPWCTAGCESAAFSAIARHAQIISGYDEWIARLESFAARLNCGKEDDDSVLNRFPGIGEATELLLARVRELQSVQALLPPRATQRAFAEAVDALLDSLEIPGNIRRYPDSDVSEREQAALDAVRDLLETLADADTGGAISRESFVQRFLLGLQESVFACPGDRAGVVCFDAASIRGLEFEHVFFGGLNEGETPAPPSVNAIYTDLDVMRLRRAGIPLESRREHDERERMLFHHVIDSARASLTLSWRLLKGGGREAMRSPFLSEIIDLFAGRARVLAPAPLSDAFLPKIDDIASARDLRNAAIHRRIPVQGMYPEDFNFIGRGAAIELQRHDASPFGAYDGVFSDQALIDAVGAHYGGRHLFSVQQIETYLECPFRFFAQRVLKVEEMDAPEAEFDPLLAGAILHDALQQFHERFRGLAVQEIPPEEADAAMRDALEAAFRSNATAPRGAAAAERLRMETALLRYLAIERGRNGDARWKPSHFEVAFGRDRGHSRDPLTTPTPFALETPEGLLRFSGRIDRIDRSDRSVRLIDYKRRGTPSSSDITSGRSVQLSVYAWAAERLLLPDAACEEACYVPVGRDEIREALGKGRKGHGWETREAKALEGISRAVRGIRAGSFPPTPAPRRCEYCAFANVCRHEASRIERKAPAFAEKSESDGTDETAA